MALVRTCQSLWLQETGAAVTAAVSAYNLRCRAHDSELTLPEIEMVRVCLLSGGKFKHPSTSKNEVAEALMKGLLSTHDGGTSSPQLDFAYDGDVFREVWRSLRAVA
eukprot:gnl/TRDRNA2_/TRDRNA2_126857_c0_seq2.p1 gnl/TRDRNA2_/TRDRNA2_126857_c0~~gnl/TRDRNA2_/TRDRNA2_126857_c0_seq2.p1  ORF type:complete len:107 (+),score=13.16 gnl/TRDRNA2_/TRDRNA2_126857_c0_seq2:33-353(+)